MTGNWQFGYERFSDPGNDSRVMAAWQRFLLGSELPGDALRSLIEYSWQRCRDYNVDPEKRGAPSLLSEKRIARLRQDNSELLQASEPVMAHARDFLAETGTVMALADTSSIILSMEGDLRTRNAAENIRLLPGALWSEQTSGTNAIGTALAVGEPVQIHSAEHYCFGVKRWTCSATVIRHPGDGEILGVVDVSGLSETWNRQSLALVVTTAKRIENRLTIRETGLRMQLLEATLPHWSQNNDNVVLFDHRGYPIKASGDAQLILRALGAELNLQQPRRIPALALPHANTLPAWLDPDWLQAITENGHHIGTLLRLPAIHRNHSTTTGHTSAAATRPNPANNAGFANIISIDPALQSVVRKASVLANSSVPILLLGETGVGKEEFAHGIHHNSPHNQGPFVPLNCGGLSRELLASELFGYVDGAFTGARKGGQIGKLEAANGGTLFLDEIGEMPLELQPHLLRVLEQGEIYRLGENKARKIDFRLVAATNLELREEVAAGRFRMDLYYRIAVTSIRIPALRAHLKDLPVLAEHFLQHFAHRHQRPKPAISPALLQQLARYDWPGNIRELRNVIENMLLVTTGPNMDLDALPAEIASALQPPATGNEYPPQCPPQYPPTPPTSTSHPLSGIQCAEAQAIIRAIEHTNGNLTRAARTLGIAKSTLYQKVRHYQLNETITHARQRG